MVVLRHSQLRLRVHRLGDACFIWPTKGSSPRLVGRQIQSTSHHFLLPSIASLVVQSLRLPFPPLHCVSVDVLVSLCRLPCAMHTGGCHQVVSFRGHRQCTLRTLSNADQSVYTLSLCNVWEKLLGGGLMGMSHGPRLSFEYAPIDEDADGMYV